ncbi:MAG: hypothetical protein ABEJ80_03905 [Halarchaeum sp.]
MERITGEVVHVLGPDEHEDALQADLRELAAGHHVVVCRRGGSPSFLERALAFLRGASIDAVTVVLDDPPGEGETLAVDARETAIPGVYDATADDETE